MTGRDTTEAKIAQRSMCELADERAGIVRVDRARLPGSRTAVVAGHVPGRDRTLPDERGQRCAGDAGDVAHQETTQVDDVAADIAERARASQAARVAPGEGNLWAGRIVREIPGAELARLADHATAHRGLDGGQGRRAAEIEAHSMHHTGLA